MGGGEGRAGGRDFKDLHNQNTACFPLRLKTMQTLLGNLGPQCPQLSRIKFKLLTKHAFIP